jgi:PIN domain nuclease of toxin-antitoxin system
MSAYLDTHVAVWMHAGLIERLSVEAKRQIEKQDLLLSPMVLLELQFLHDRKRIRALAEAIVKDLNSDFGVNLCTLPFPAVVREAMTVDWTSDPFDRIIVAQAAANRRERLITADDRIRKHYDRAVW